MRKWHLLAGACIAALLFSEPVTGQEVPPNPPPSSHGDGDGKRCIEKEDLIDGFDSGLEQEIDSDPQVAAAQKAVELAQQELDRAKGRAAKAAANLATAAANVASAGTAATTAAGHAALAAAIKALGNAVTRDVAAHAAVDVAQQQLNNAQAALDALRKKVNKKIIERYGPGDMCPEGGQERVEEPPPKEHSSNPGGGGIFDHVTIGVGVGIGGDHHHHDDDHPRDDHHDHHD